MSDVFLSYKRGDAERVRKLVAALRETGLDVWWDEDIPPAAPWEATIETALANAKAVIVCWSPTSVVSENVRSEARVAREDGRLIQAFLKRCSPPLFFGERQGVDLTKWRGNVDDSRIRRLAEAVRNVAAGERLEDEAINAVAFRPGWWKAPKLRRILAIAAAMLVLIGTATLVAYRTLVSASTPQVAVIPFEDLSAAHDKAYFAEGISEEILSALSTDQGIKVLGRTSARQIHRNADPRAVRKSLGVTHLLEGSTRTAGNALRVNVRLIDTSDGSTVWQDEYQGRLADVFGVQQQIAGAVVEQVHGLFAGPATVRERPVTGADAYDLYLAARALMRTRSIPTLEKSLTMAKRVVESQPNYAPGHALYAQLVFHLSDDPIEYGNVPIEQARKVAQAHALRAIQLAPNAADGYAALGLSSLGDQKIAALKRAIALDPSRAEVRLWLGEGYDAAGEHDLAFRQAQLAREIEPLWAVPVYRVIINLASSRRFEEALKVVQRYESIGGDRAHALRFRWAIAARQGDHARSISYAEQALKLDPTLPYMRLVLSHQYYILGFNERAQSAFPNENEPLRNLFFKNQRPLIVERVRAADPAFLNAPDIDIAIFTLGAARAWGPLAGLYHKSGMNPAAFCAKLPGMTLPVGLSMPVAQALAATGARTDARELLNCVRRRLDRTIARTYRSGTDPAGQGEVDRAQVLALSGDKNGALTWLKRAIDFGWIGHPYSSQLIDWPAFDDMRGDPRLARLQAEIDRRIARQRSQVISQLQPSGSPS